MPAELEHLFFSSLSSTQYFPVIFLFFFFFFTSTGWKNASYAADKYHNYSLTFNLTPRLFNLPPHYSSGRHEFNFQIAFRLSP